jgi:multidrug efflux pump subunit AcrA (membrane-fusion protein)
VEEEGALFYVIKDPVSQRFFRIKPLEHFLITQFDGGTDFEEIRRRASERYRVLVGPDVLLKFAKKFVDLELLVRPGQELRELGTRSGSRFSRALFIKFPLVNPERFLDWLYPKIRWAMSPWFVTLMALTIVFATVVALNHRENLVFGLRRIASIEGLLLIYLTVSVVTIFHELAHGLTCRHFGGQVQDMGFLLLYFTPCFYCNVSDTYLFKEKRQRIWVTFSGGFFELTLWALAVLAWRVAAPETFASRLFFVVIAVCGIKSLFNFNPLIKLDGYYMLADYLGVANLRKEALGGLGRFLRRRLLGLDVEPPRPDLGERSFFSMRGDRFVALFGAAALTYTMVLLGYIIFWSGDWVYHQYGSNGLGLFSMVLLGLLHKQATTAVSSLKTVGKEKWDQLGKKNKRVKSSLKWLVAILVLVLFPWPLRVTSELEVLPQARVSVRAPAEGRIERILFQEGQRVRKGDLVLEYDTQELRLEKKDKEAEYEQAQVELRLLQQSSPTRQEEIRVQEQALQTARAEEEAARQNFDRVEGLWKEALVSRERFDQALNTLKTKQSETARQEAQVKLVRKASRTNRDEQMAMLHLRDPAAQKAVISGLETELARLDDLLARSRIYAPISGTLTTYRFQEKIGEYLEEGDDVCEIMDDDNVVIEMRVPEKEMDVVKLGNPVKFKVRGYPSRQFDAEIVEIAPVAERQENTSTILVRASIDNPDHLLKPGMTGVAKIICGRTVLSHILFRDMIRFVRTEFWIF